MAEQETYLQMKKIETVSQLDSVRRQPRAMVFLWVDWAMQARDSARAVEKVVDRWNRDNPNALLALSQIDLSEQSGGMWDAVTDWLTSEGLDATSLMYGGAGSALWVRAGNIVRHAVNAAAQDAGLFPMTVDAFGLPNRSAVEGSKEDNQSSV